MAKISIYSTSDNKILNIELFWTVIIATMIIHFGLGVHAAISLVLSLVIGAILYFLFMTSIGFWIVTTIFSICWAGVLGEIAYAITDDNVWKYVIFVLTFIGSISLHKLAKRYETNVGYFD